jgi:hypothetical protein
LKGILSPDSTETGNRLRGFTPMPAAEGKEEPKDKKDEPKN